MLTRKEEGEGVGKEGTTTATADFFSNCRLPMRVVPTPDEAPVSAKESKKYSSLEER